MDTEQEAEQSNEADQLPESIREDVEQEKNRIDMVMNNKRIIKRPAPEEAKQLVGANQSMMIVRNQITNLAIDESMLADKRRDAIKSLVDMSNQYKAFIEALQDKYGIKGRYGKVWAVDTSNGDILSLEPAEKPQLDESKKRKVAKVPIKKE